MTTDLRKTSEVEHGFPYAARAVCFFTMKGGRPTPIGNSATAVRAAAHRAAHGGATVYAVWPGQWRSDLFVVDEPKAMLAALGGAL